MSTATLLPPEAVATNSMGLEEAIKEFVQIDARMSELILRKKEILSILVPAAYEVRGTTSTTRLDNHDQSVRLKVEFKKVVKTDSPRLDTVKEMLGDDFFEELFKTEYSPKQRVLKPFLASKSTDERIETAKAIIRESMVEHELSPQITIEKGRLEI